MGKWKFKPMKGKEQENETYLQYDYKMFLSSQFMEKHWILTRKHIKMCKYYCFSCLSLYILFYITLEWIAP